MFKEIENCNLVGINDSNIEQAKVVGEEFGVNVFESINDLLNKVEAVQSQQQQALITILQKYVSTPASISLSKNQ